MKNSRKRMNVKEIAGIAEKSNLENGKSDFRKTEGAYISFPAVIQIASAIQAYETLMDEILQPTSRLLCNYILKMRGNDVFSLLQFLKKRKSYLSEEELFQKAADNSFTTEEIVLISQFLNLDHKKRR